MHVFERRWLGKSLNSYREEFFLYLHAPSRPENRAGVSYKIHPAKAYCVFWLRFQERASFLPYVSHP
jgi:hypothetical protein